MIFEINNFKIETAKKIEYLIDEILVPQNIIKGKPAKFNWEHKTREFVFFTNLYLKEEKDNKFRCVINDVFNFIDLIEVLKAFSSKKLNIDKVYDFKYFTANFTQKDGNHYIKILFLNNSYALFYDRFEATSLAAKFQKILSRCEAWQEQEV